MSHQTKKTVLYFFLMFVCTGLFAQINLNKAKDLVKDKSSNEKSANEKSAKPEPKAAPATERPAPAAAEPRSSGTEKSDNRFDRAKTNAKPGADDRYKPSTVELDFASEPFAPAVSWASLLSENCWYFNPTTGDMKLNNLMVSFLPKKTVSGDAVRYESYHNPTPLLRMEVWDTRNNVLKNTMHYSGSDATLPFTELEVIEGYEYKPYAKLTEGSYELRFWAGTKHFYTHAFNIEKQNNPDPYAPVHDFYFLRGPWQDWGRVEFGPDGHFIFNFYVNYETTTIPNQARWDVAKPFKYQLKMYRDGKMVAVHSLQHIENQLEWSDSRLTNGTWKKFDATFHTYPPAGKGQGAGTREWFLKDHMKDGAYKVEVLLKDEAGAITTHTYSFTVKGGQILPAPEADRSKNTDPLHFLEQGPGRFYVKKGG